MTFPSAPTAPTSAVTVWTQMTALARATKEHAISDRVLALAGLMTESQVLATGRALVEVIQYFTANAGTAGLQTYARLATGNASLDLSTEWTALRTLIRGVFTGGKILLAIQLPRATIDDDGNSTPGRQTYGAGEAAEFTAALDALIAGIE